MQENPQTAFCCWLNERIRGHVPHFLFCSSACCYKRSDTLHSAQSWQLLLQVRAAKFSPSIYQRKSLSQFAIKASHLLFWGKISTLEREPSFPLFCSFGAALVVNVFFGVFFWKKAQKKSAVFMQWVWKLYWSYQNGGDVEKVLVEDKKDAAVTGHQTKTIRRFLQESKLLFTSFWFHSLVYYSNLIHDWKSVLETCFNFSPSDEPDNGILEQIDLIVL